MTDASFARTGVDPVSRCLLGCGAAVAAEGQDEHRKWHAEIGRLAIRIERLRDAGRWDLSRVATIDMP